MKVPVETIKMNVISTPFTLEMSVVKMFMTVISLSRKDIKEILFCQNRGK